MATVSRPLPTEADAAELLDALRHVFNLIEAASWAVSETVKRNDAASGDEWKLAPGVTLEELGVLAIMLADISRNISDFSELKCSLEAEMFSLSAIRADRELWKKDGGDDA